LVKIRPVFKFWLETDEGYVFGEGPFEILSKIQETGTLSGAVKVLKISYRQAWGMIKDIEKELGEPLLKTSKGGVSGGGGSELTEVSLALLDKYSKTKQVLAEFSKRITVDYF